jgi:hypothetical protein
MLFYLQTDRTYSYTGKNLLIARILHITVLHMDTEMESNTMLRCPDPCYMCAKPSRTTRNGIKRYNVVSNRFDSYDRDNSNNKNDNRPCTAKRHPSSNSKRKETLTQTEEKRAQLLTARAAT